MFGKILTFLAWTGLWQPAMIILNVNTPAPRQHINATEMTHTTSRFMEAILDHFGSIDGQKMSYAELEQSDFYTRSFHEFGGLLKNTQPQIMEKHERQAFFINLYNILTIHAILHINPTPTSTISVANFWQRYAYQVGPYTLHLDDIEHGILRGNHVHPVSGKVMFKRNDGRNILSISRDRRIHGALNCGAMSCPRLRSYSSDNIDTELDTAMKGFCNKSVTINADGSLVINQIFQWFRVDFGATEPDALRWLADCVDDTRTQEAVRQAALGTRSFSYDYNWTLNNVSTGNSASISTNINIYTSLIVLFITLLPLI